MRSQPNIERSEDEKDTSKHIKVLMKLVTYKSCFLLTFCVSVYLMLSHNCFARLFLNRVHSKTITH